MNALDLVAAALLAAAAFFFLSGTVGLLRFPDLFTRLHALTKADNLGLGLVAVALAVRSGSVAVGAKLILVWLLALVASSTSCHLVGRAALHNGVPGVPGVPGSPAASSGQEPAP